MESMLCNGYTHSEGMLLLLSQKIRDHDAVETVAELGGMLKVQATRVGRGRLA
jgi:hypothetical protein